MAINIEAWANRNTFRMLEAELSLVLMFENGKKVSKIQIIIHMYDSDCGDAGGYIKSIELVR